MLITANNITKSFRRKGRAKSSVQILQSTDVSIQSGNVYVILGRSGSGKSTLINILSGLLLPSGGSVKYNDTDIYSLTDGELSQLRCRRVGYIPQGQSAVATLTVRENVLLPSAVIGEGKSFARADELLKQLGLSELGDASPTELSGGELRRLAIARALINSPEVIFADEPTNDLDEENSRLVFEQLKKAAESGAAVVIVTHELFAYEFADTVYRMQSGSLIREKGQ